MRAWPHPAYAIRTPRLVLRCYEQRDVDAVHEAVLTNMEALRPWMAWIDDEPLSRDARVERVRRDRGHFDLGEEFVYGVFDATGGRMVGAAGLHPRSSPGVLEIGYWIVHERWGHGLATEVASALTRVGFERMKAARMEIRVEPKNPRSMAIPRKLGFREEGLLRRAAPGGPNRPRRDLVVFGMLPSELSSSPAAGIVIRTESFG